MGGPHARATLSPREREVLDLVGQGLSNDEIGRRLHITRDTARLHATRGIRKLVQRLRVTDDGGMTWRDRDVIELLREGLSDLQIAQRLNIGVRSAETYVTRVLRKLGLAVPSCARRPVIRTHQVSLDGSARCPICLSEG
jgi:DNA-binding CsgD family transcriptional regulator